MPNSSKNPAAQSPETHPSPLPTRRSFAKSIVITIGAMVVASLITLREWYRLRSAPAIIIAHTGEIPIGGTKIFQYPTDVAPCILLRTGESTYVAYSRICTHNSCPVFYRPDESAFECRCHGGLFSFTDGSVLAGPPPRSLPRIQLAIRGADILAVGVALT